MLRVQQSSFFRLVFACSRTDLALILAVFHEVVNAVLGDMFLSARLHCLLQYCSYTAYGPERVEYYMSPGCCTLGVNDIDVLLAVTFWD